MADLRYPADLRIDEDTDWLSITAYKYDAGTPGTLSTSGAGAMIPGASFILPIPSNIQDGNSVSYGDDKLNNFTARGLDIAKTMMGTDIAKIISGDFSQVKISGDKIGGLLLDSDFQNIIKQSLAAEAVSIFGGNVSIDQLLARESGSIMNPNMELLFNGVTLRSFRFSFKMTPRSDNEAENIKAIIRGLKTNMAPIGKPGDDFLSTPNIFKLAYKKGGGDHPFLHKFKDCALTDMSVNYTGENVYATYHDGTPISMVMDLTFKELVPIYQGDYVDNEGKVLDDTVGY